MLTKHLFFAIFSPARCRSSYLCSLLHSHPEIICHSELFHQDKSIFGLREIQEDDKLYDLIWRNNHPQAYIERILNKTQYYHPHAKWVGCKMLLYPYQMNHGLDAILDFKPKMILLSRNNKLAWYSSLKIAQETGTWYIDERNCAVQHTISFNAKEFNEILELNTLCEKIILRELKYRNIDYIKFDYDELIQDNIIKQILDFLDLPYANLESHVLAQNTLNILKRFKNQEEVISFAAAKEKLAWLEQVPDNNFKK